MPVKNITKALDYVKANINNKTVLMLNGILDLLVRESKKVIAQKATDTGKLGKAIEKKVEAKLKKAVITYIGTVFINKAIAPYGNVIHEGRRPGKNPPPMEDIKKWMIRNKIEPKYRVRRKLKHGFIEYTPSMDQLAFMISRNIGKKGKKGIKFFDIALKNAAPQIAKEVAIAGFTFSKKHRG